MYLVTHKKIGQALMVPVAALPAAALLMGIGYWIDPDGWGANSQLAALLIKSGAAIIDNMGLLFAVGVAFGLAKDKHGSAALSGLCWFLRSNHPTFPCWCSTITTH